MAINPQKLLPPSKISTTSERMENSYDKKIDDILNMKVNKKLIDADKFLKSSLLQKKKDKSKKRKEKETKTRQENETKLETPKGIGGGIEKIKSLIPKTGLLDAVQRFAIFTFAGWLFGKFSKDLPKLMGIVNKISPVVNTAEKIIGGIFEGVVNFIDAGYKTHDQIRKLSKDIGGEKAKKTYDEFSKNFNDTINRILTLGLYQPSENSEIPKKEKGGIVAKESSQTKGQSTRAGEVVGKVVKRNIKIQQIKKPLQTTPQKSNPGKDVGGKLRIEKLYPNPKVTKTNVPNPYKALTGVSKTLKTGGWIGELMGVGVDVALGQKPDPKIYSTIANGIGYLSKVSADEKINSSMNVINNSVLGAENGGMIPVLGTDYRRVNVLKKTLQSLIQDRVNQALQNVMKEVNKVKGTRGGGVTGPFGGGAGDGAGGYAEGETNFVSSKEIYDYLKSKGVSHNHAMGMLANIQAESSFNAGAIGDGGTSGGLFQHHAERFDGMVAFAGEDWAKNWKRQVDYALREESGKQYIAKDFKSPAEASSWFTLNFERPSNAEYKASQRVGNLKNFGKDGSWQGPQGGNIQAPKTKLDFKKLGLSVGEEAGYSESRGRMHRGRDIAIQEGTPLRTLNDSEIIDVGEDGGYGYYVIFRDKNGRETFYGHLKEPSNRKVGDKLLANSIVGYVGSTGYSTGPHLHWEVSDKPNEVGIPRKNVSDPLKLGYKAEDPFGGELNPKPKKEDAKKEKSFTRVVDGKTWKKRPDGKWQTGSGRGTIIISNAEFNQRILESRKKQTPKTSKKSSSISNASIGGKQGGGLIGEQNRRNYSSLSTYPSYDSMSGAPMIIQPIIVEKPVPIPIESNKTIMFPVPIALNNNNMTKLSR